MMCGAGSGAPISRPRTTAPMEDSPTMRTMPWSPAPYGRRYPLRSVTAMSRMTAFQSTLQPTAEQETLFKVAGGAARLTYNVLLGQVKDALDSRERDPTVKVPSRGGERQAG